VSLVLALVLVGRADWPRQRFAGVAAAATILRAGYTVWSEWLNATIRGAWAYAVAMPRVPPLGTGLAPLAQWLILPALCLTAARHAVRGSSSPVITRSEATAAPSPPRAASSKH
jgi:hypothetical protein